MQRYAETVDALIEQRLTAPVLIVTPNGLGIAVPAILVALGARSRSGATCDARMRSDSGERTPNGW